jgi:hypothetical protein
MDGTIVHEKDGVLTYEFVIGWQFLNVVNEDS